MNDYQYEVKDTLLAIDNVSLRLGGNQILKGVNAEIRDIVRPGMTQGQIVGLLGPSGVGKTKLFEIMAGLLTDVGKDDEFTGGVYLGSERVPVKAGRVGVVQQNYPLFNHRTVMSNMDVAASMKHKGTDKKDRINEMLVTLGMDKHADKYPAQLSGGQRQRVAVAQQMLCSDGILLLDEPFSGLDVLSLEKVCELITKVANSHETSTVIVVSHDITATAAIADTLWIMGRDWAPDETGASKPVPGSRIKHTHDMAKAGLAWRPNITKEPAFNDLVITIRDLFHTL